MSSEYRPEVPPPYSIRAAMERVVAGQSRAAGQLADIIHAHYENVGVPGQTQTAPGEPQAARHALVVGPRGSGRSRMVREAARSVGVPLIVVDAAHLVAEVLSGGGVEKWAGSILISAADDLPTAEKAIIVIRDMDCLRDGFIADGREIGADEAQRIIAGIIADRTFSFRDPERSLAQVHTSTSAILFLCFGELADIAEMAAPRGRTAGASAGRYDNLERHLILPELAQAFGYTVVMDRPDEAALRRALTASPQGIIPRYQRLFEAHGIDLVFTQEAVDTAVALARVDGRGEYAATGLVSRCIEGLEFRLPALTQGGVSHVVVTKGSVHLGFAPQMDGDLPPPASDPRPVPPQDLSAQIEDIERELRMDKANTVVRAWWRAFKAAQRAHPEVVLRTCQRLRRRGFGIADAYRAIMATETTNIDCIMLYLDYMRAWSQLVGPRSYRDQWLRRPSPQEFAPPGPMQTITELVLSVLRDHFDDSEIAEATLLEGRYALSDASWREIHDDIAEALQVPGLPVLEPVRNVQDLVRLATIAADARNRRHPRY